MFVECQCFLVDKTRAIPTKSVKALRNIKGWCEEPWMREARKDIWEGQRTTPGLTPRLGSDKDPKLGTYFL